MVEELKDSNRGKNGMKRLFLEEIGVGNQGCYRSGVVGCEEGIMAGRYGEFGGSGLSLADFSFSLPLPLSLSFLSLSYSCSHCIFLSLPLVHLPSSHSSRFFHIPHLCMSVSHLFHILIAIKN